MNNLNTSTAPRSYICPKCHRESFNPNDVRYLFCGACNIFAEDLRDEPVTMFAHLTPRRLTKRDAFSLAALTLFESAHNPHARLVHGIARNSFNPGEYVQHAWCEFPATVTYDNGMRGPSAVVCDYSQPDERMYFILRDQFYTQMGVRDTKRFTRDEMIARAKAGLNDGPWVDSPGGA